MTVLGILSTLSEFFNLSPIALSLAHWNRDNPEFRYYMVKTLLPFADNIFLESVLRSFFELATIWSALFLFQKSPEHKKLLIGSIAIGLIFCLLASSRGTLIAVALIAGAQLLDHRPLLRRVAQVGIIPVSYIITQMSTKFLNGRSTLYSEALSKISWSGHGLGSSANLASVLSEGRNDHLHNIHFEMLYDWGGFAYVVWFAVVLSFLFNRGYLRVSIILFVSCALSYTIYSPWVAWTVFFAWLADRRSKT
jgi:hypothetical protein